MPTALIIGSGPGAAGAALALAADPAQQITVIDVGGTLEPELRSTVGRLATTAEGSWSPADLESISRQPVAIPRGVLPEKRSYGSDFPFRDAGQLAGIEPLGAANPSVVSGCIRWVLEHLGCPDHALLQAHVRSMADHGSRDGAPLPHRLG